MKANEINGNQELNLETESQQHGLRISVVGVGNGGLKVIETLVKRELKGVNLIAADTDYQTLNKSNAPTKVKLGPKKTMGNGAGGNPELGKEATLEVKEDIAGHFKESNMVIVISMLGKGTGSGGAPEILKTAKERNILTLGLAVMPYEDEGHTDIANAAVKEIAKTSDAYMLLSNENMDALGEEITLIDAYERMNSVLANSVQALVEIVKETGYINANIEDIKRVLGKGGRCLISKSEVQTGDDRALTAVDNAVSDPLFQISMLGAQNIMIYAIPPKDFKLRERRIAMERIRLHTDGEPNITWSMSKPVDDVDGFYIYLIASGISEIAKDSAKDINNTNSVNELRDEEVFPVEDASEPELAVVHNSPYHSNVQSYNIQTEPYRGSKKRPVTETGKNSHVVTNILNRRGGQSELSSPPGRLNFPNNKKSWK